MVFKSGNPAYAETEFRWSPKDSTTMITLGKKSYQVLDDFNDGDLKSGLPVKNSGIWNAVVYYKENDQPQSKSVKSIKPELIYPGRSGFALKVDFSEDALGDSLEGALELTLAEVWDGLDMTPSYLNFNGLESFSFYGKGEGTVTVELFSVKSIDSVRSKWSKNFELTNDWKEYELFTNELARLLDEKWTDAGEIYEIKFFSNGGTVYIDDLVFWGLEKKVFLDF